MTRQRFSIRLLPSKVDPMRSAVQLATVMLEADTDFDPEDYLKSGGDTSAIDIHKDDKIWIVQPLTYGTLRDLTPWFVAGRQEFEEMNAEGPLFLYYPDPPKGRDAVLLHFASSTFVKGGQKAARDFKPEDYPHGEELARVLGLHFLGKVRQGKDRAANLRNLIQVGFAAQAVPYVRSLGRIPLRYSEAAKLAVAIQSIKGRRLPGFLQKRFDDDVILKPNGVMLLYDDWGDLNHLFPIRQRQTAEAVFSGDIESYDNDSRVPAKDVMGYANEDNLNRIRYLIVGKPVEEDDHFEGGTFSREDVLNLDDGDIANLLDSQDSMEEILRRVQWAASDAERSATEAAYFNGYKGAVEDELGEGKWIQRGRGKKQKSVLGFFIPYSKIEDWIDEYKENSGYDEFEGSLHDLVSEMVSVSAADSYSGDWDKELFNEHLDHHLHDLEPDEPEETEDPQQAQLKLDEPRNPGKSLYTLYGPEFELGKPFWLMPKEYEDYVAAYPQFKSRHAYKEWKTKHEQDQEASRQRATQRSMSLQYS